MPIKTLLSYALFGGAFLTKRRTTGSVLPSSPFLGKRMAARLPREDRGLVVELGVGTGAITQSLLESGLTHDQLVAVDCSPEMVDWTKKRFPQAKIMLGDASKLRELIDSDKELCSTRVKHVVSSLPLKSLPKDVVRGIANEVKEILPEGDKLIQFTYDLRKRPDPHLHQFRLVESSVVWLNVPPARVSVYEVA